MRHRDPDETLPPDEDTLIQSLLPIVSMPRPTLRAWLKRFYSMPLSRSDTRTLLEAVQRLRPDEFQFRPSPKVLGKSSYEKIMSLSPAEINTYLENIFKDPEISPEYAKLVRKTIYNRRPSLRPRRIGFLSRWSIFKLCLLCLFIWIILSCFPQVLKLSEKIHIRTSNTWKTWPAFRKVDTMRLRKLQIPSLKSFKMKYS